jgi:hypothetical protein
MSLAACDDGLDDEVAPAVLIGDPDDPPDAQLTEPCPFPAVATGDTKKAAKKAAARNAREQCEATGCGAGHCVARSTGCSNSNGVFTCSACGACANIVFLDRYTAGYTKGDTSWAFAVTCLQAMFSRWKVDVTDVAPEPGKTFVQAIFGGDRDGAWGFGPRSCTPHYDGRAFIYNAVPPGQLECETAAQEIGHSFALDHEYLCADPMTYLQNCGGVPKTFQDMDARCGEGGPRDCFCGTARQNSVQSLNLTLGAW